MACPIVTFCGPCSRIIVCCLACDPLAICSQTFLYSHWKKAILDGCLNAGFLSAFSTTGGDPVTATQNLSGYFFLVNGWRVKPAEKNQSYLVEGNLFVCGGVTHPFVNTTGCFNTFVAINTSAQSLTTSTITLSAAGEASVVDAVWDEVIACHLTAGSTGAALSTAGAGSCPCAIADAVWDEALSGHVTAGSAGKALGDIDTCGLTTCDIPTKQEIAEQVWKEDLPGCFDIGSAGQRLSDASDCIDALLGSIATTNWTAAEKSQIRDALGVDGTKVDSTGGVVQKIKNKVNTIFALLFK